MKFVGFAIALFFTLLSSNSLADTEKERNTQIPDVIEIPQSDLVYFTTSHGEVIMQLTDIQSPKGTANFKSLIQEGFYDGLDFYRVIEGFVAQAGDGGNDEKEPKATKFRGPIVAEFTAKSSPELDFHSIQNPALLAPETGFINGFPAGRDAKTNEHWLLHCPGTLALARTNDPNSASTEFYVVLGHAPRHLDRNMSIIGRVVKGMDVLQRMPRGDNAKGGVIANDKERGKILSAKLGSQLVKNKQLSFVVDNTYAEKFQTRLASARNNTGPFLVYPGSGNVDVCYYRPRIKQLENN